MAVLKIYNDIMSEDDKFWYQWWGQDGVCYKDVEAFTASIPKDDDTIDMRIFCNGGNVQEGWAIYDRLRQSGKQISCTIEGKAASMATIIMLAAPKERRHAYENASILVHNPWVPGWALGDTLKAEELRNYSEELQMEQNKMVDLYVERCGCDRQEIQTLMDKDIFISTDKAIELGLINDVLPPMSANTSKRVIHDNVNKKTKAMAKEDEKKVSIGESFAQKIAKFFGKKSIEEITFGMELNTADGQVLTVEREEGEPQVGDKASPDGTFEMPDGKTIVVKEGVIDSITTSNDNSGENEGESGNNSESSLAEQVAKLTAEREELQAQLDRTMANAKTKEDMLILNAIKIAGGTEKVLGGFASHFTPEPRQPEGKQAAKRADGSEKDIILAKLKKLHNN